MASLRELLEISWALPADVSDDGDVLVRWNLPGSFQLYIVPSDDGDPVQVTDLAEPVTGLFVPGSDRILLSVDEGGNERAQLYLLDRVPGATLEPLVVEHEFRHDTPSFSADGRLLAYACNCCNGRDLDVYIHSLETGEEQRVFSGGYCEVAGFSPDGRWLGVFQRPAAPATTISISSTSSTARPSWSRRTSMMRCSARQPGATTRVLSCSQRVAGETTPASPGSRSRRSRGATRSRTRGTSIASATGTAGHWSSMRTRRAIPGWSSTIPTASPSAAGSSCPIEG